MTIKPLLNSNSETDIAFSSFADWELNQV